MKTFKALERKSQLFGLPLQDLLLLLLGFSLAILLGIIMNFFINITRYYFLMVSGCLILGVFLLKRVQRHRHPSYLLSLLSFHFFQPKWIRIKSGAAKMIK